MYATGRAPACVRAPHINMTAVEVSIVIKKF